jgi:hypothetical protein
LDRTLGRSHLHSFTVIPNSSHVVRPGPEVSWIQARFSFETEGETGAQCSGIIGLVPDTEHGWRVWVLSTILEQIKGFPSPDVFEPRVTADGETDGFSAIPKVTAFDCVVVGASMAGLCTAGRLKALGVSSVTLERNAQIGDNWMSRYESAKREGCCMFLWTNVEANLSSSPYA